MPKNTRITAATTTATRRIIAPKLGVSSPSICRESSHARAGITEAVTTRTLVLGDWGRVIRDPIDLLRLAFFAGAAVFAVTGQLGGAGNLLISGLLLVAARALDLPRLYDLALTLAMVLTGWGEALGLYDAISFYDNIVHFLTPLFASQVAFIALARAEVLPDPRDETGLRQHLAIFVVTAALGIAIGAVWEIFEWFSDGTFGSKLQTGNDDTVGDLIADTLGSLTGGALLVAWTVFGWGSVRRIPGENRYEDTNA
jgi:hypothetical protein